MSIDKASQIVYANVIIRPIIEVGFKNSIGEDSSAIKSVAAELANRFTSPQSGNSQAKSTTNPLPRFGGDQ